MDQRVPTLKQRIGLVLLVCALVPSLIYLMALKLSISRGLIFLEERDMAERVERARWALDFAVEQLLTESRDYAMWDDVYDQMEQLDLEWLKRNLGDWLPQNAGIELILAVDMAGQPRFHFGEVDPFLPAPGDAPGVRQALGGTPAGGLATVSGGLFLVATSPILHSDESGPQRGVLLLGKPVTEDLLAALSRQTGDTIAVEGARGGVAGSGLERPDRTLLVARSALTDINGRTAATLVVSARRDNILSTMANLRQTFYLVVVVSLIAALLSARFLLRHLVGPLASLRDQIGSIKKRGRFLQVRGSGYQEITELAGAFNEMAASLQEHLKRNAVLDVLSTTDGLTGLYNHRFFHERLAGEIRQGGQNGGEFTIVLLDLNHFKHYNDVWGHPGGDGLLNAVGLVIGGQMRQGDILARYGGDEFAAILPGTGEEGATRLVGTILETLEGTDFAGKDKMPGGRISASAGLAVFPQHGTTAEELLRRADRELYKMKSVGAGRLARYYDVFKLVTQGSESTEQLLAAARTLLMLINANDNYTYWHTVRVTAHCADVARHLGWEDREREKLVLAASLHDLGKIEIGRAILCKPGSLTPEEWDVVKQHPEWGADMVRTFDAMGEVAQWIECHHERFDGTGYPKGLRGDDIPPAARIIAVADSFDAMTTNRPYRRALTPEEAIAELRRGAGTLFDPAIVEAFVATWTEHPAGPKPEYLPEYLSPLLAGSG